MWIAAWSVDQEHSDAVLDEWSVHDTQGEADAAILEAEAKHDGLYCWAVAPIFSGSEPHYPHPGLAL